MIWKFLRYVVILKQVKSVKLLTEIGFKTQVTLDDVLEILQTWRTMKCTLTAR